MPRMYFSWFFTGIIQLMESDIFYSKCSIKNSGKGRDEEKKKLGGKELLW